MRTKTLIGGLLIALGTVSVAPAAHANLSAQEFCNSWKMMDSGLGTGWEAEYGWNEYKNPCQSGGGFGGGYGGGGYTDPYYWEPGGGGGGGGGTIGGSGTKNPTTTRIGGVRVPPLPAQVKKESETIQRILREHQRAMEAAFPTESSEKSVNEETFLIEPQSSDSGYDERLTALQEQAAAPRAGVAPVAQTKRAAFKVKAEAAREEFSVKLEAAREEIKTLILTRKDELKAKLDTFTDMRKKTVATRVDEALTKINDRWVTTFTASVNRINGVVEAITSRADKAEASGKDVASVRAKIETAKAAIAAARTVIESQAAKDYTLTVQDETTVKADATATRDQIKEDLAAVRTAVRAAFDAAKDAASALRAIPGIEADVQAEALINAQQ